MAYPGAEYQFTEVDYTATEGVDSHITVTVRQKSDSPVDIHLLVIPLTYAQYEQRRMQPDSTLAPIDTFHRNRPDPAECKLINNLY